MPRVLLVFLVSVLFQTETANTEVISGRPASDGVGVARSGSLNCNDRRQYLSAHIRRDRSVVDTIVDVAKAEKELIIFGESHVHFEAIARYPEFIELIRANRGVNCIFIEGKDDFQKAIDRYFRGESYGSTVQAVNTQVPGRKPLAHASKALLDYAKSKNIKVYAVDTDDDSTFARDRHMSKQVNRYMKSEECTQPVMLVGKAHITGRLKSTHPKAAEGVSLPDRLRESGISVSSINMISHFDLKKSFVGYGDGCPNPPSFPTKDYGFSISYPAPAIEKEALDAFEPNKWDDFQAAIVVN